MANSRELEFVIKFRNEARNAVRNVSSDLAKLNQQTINTAKQQAMAAQQVAASGASMKKTSAQTVQLVKNGKQLSDQQKDLIQKFSRTSQAVTGLLGPLAGVTSRFNSLTSVVGDAGLKMAALALGVGAVSLALVKAIGITNQYTTLVNRLTVALDGKAGVNEALDKLRDISARTRSPLEANIQLFQRASLAAKELGASQSELFKFTEAIGNAISIQGGSASAASGALLQLSQALGAGIVRAEEFNSILEGAFPIAQAAADGLDAAGGSVARLRQFIITGQVASDEFFKAILSQAKELASTFSKTSATVSQSITVLTDGFTVFIGRLDEASGLSAAVASVFLGLAGAISSLEKNIELVSLALQTLALVTITRLLLVAVSKLAQAFLALGGGAIVKAAASIYSFNGVLAATAFTSVPAFIAASRGIIAILLSGVVPALAAVRTALYTVFGGPVGLLIAAGILAYTQYTDAVNDASEASVTHADVIRQLQRVRGEYTAETEDAAEAEDELIKKHNDSVRAAIAAAEAEIKLLSVRAESNATLVARRRGRSGSGITTEDVKEARAKIEELKKEIAATAATLDNPPISVEAVKRVAEQYKNVNDELDIQISNQTRMNDAMRMGEERANEVADAIQVETQYRDTILKLEQEKVKLTDAEKASIKSKIEQSVKLNRVQENIRKEQQEALKLAEDYDKTLEESYDKVKEAYAAIKSEIEILRINPELREEEREIISLRNQLLKEGLQLSAQDEQALRAAIKERNKLQELDEVTKKNMEEQKQKILETRDAISEGLSGALQTFFNEGTDGFDTMLNQWKNMFTKFIADMVAYSVVNPLIIRLVGGSGLEGTAQGNDIIGSLLGSNGRAGGNVGGGGFSISNLISGASSFGRGSLYSLAAPGGLLSGTNVLSSIDAFGASNFGLASLPWQGETLSNVLGSGFTGGSIGGLVAGALGLGSGNFAVDTVASLAGGIGGSALASSLGLAGGPLGAVGAFALTTLAGSLFGGSNPNPAANVGVTGFNSDGTFSESNLNFKHLTEQDAQKFSDAYTQYFSALATMTGIDLATLSSNVPEGGFAFAGGVDNGTGFLSLGTGNLDKYYSNVQFDPNNEESFQNALKEFSAIVVQRVSELGGEVSDRLLNYMSNVEMEGRTLDEVLADFGFLSNFENIFKDAEEPISQTRQLVNTLNETFDNYVDTATRLGLAIEDIVRLEDQRIKELGKLQDAYEQSLEFQLREALDPTSNQIDVLLKEYSDNIEAAAALGLSTAQADELFQVKMLQLAESAGYFADTAAYGTEEAAQSAEALVDGFKDAVSEADKLADSFKRAFESIVDTLDSLYQDTTLSPLTLEERLNLARSNFASVNSRAQAGDAQALQDLPDAARQVLELSREFNASDGAYNADFEMITEELEKARQIAEDGLNRAEADKIIAEQNLAVAQDQLKELQDIASGVSDNTKAVSELSKTVFDAFFGDTSAGLVTSLANPQFQVSANNPNEIVLKNKSAIEAAGLFDVANSILKAFTPGVTAGGGTRSLYFESNDTAANAARAALKLAKVPGFARGTRSTPIGRSFMVGEQGVEIFRGSSQGQVLSNPETTNLASNSAVVGALQRMESKYDSMLGVLMRIADNSQVMANKDSGVQELRRIARNTEADQSFWNRRG